MDNITHSLFGYALGRALAGTGARREPPAPVGRALIASGVIASNAPDFDFVTGFFADDRRLAYLLDHRGFTHTLIFATVMGIATGAGCAAALKLKAAREWLAVSAAGAAACWLHIGFDFLNDYGVHPFFPFDDRWYYGDSVFIIEPLLLAVLLPLPVFFAWTRAGRGISAALSVGFLLLVWLAGLPALRALSVTLILIAAFGLQRWIGPRARPSLAASACIVAMFTAGARLAEAQARRALRDATPAEQILDIASSPAPADPTCHRALAITLDRGPGIYRVRTARVQLFGSGRACTLLPIHPTAPLTASDLRSTGAVQFDAVFSAPAAELAQLAAAECDAAHMLQFVRVPYWQRRSDGMVLGDLRYDRAPAIEFAERLLTGACRDARGAPWIPPRSDLLAFPPR